MESGGRDEYNRAMPTSLNTIRTYYDQNTKLFLAFNRSRKAENIHRSLWPENIQTLEEALNVANEKIRTEIEAVASTRSRIADLGCGVGAGLFHIVPRLKDPAFALGMTLSPVQAQLADQFVREAGLHKHIHFTEGDFTAVPLASETLDAVYSVEAVVHAPEPENYFQEASRLLRRGGKLIIVDDHRAAHTLSQAETDWLQAFIAGWHVPSVMTVAQSQTLAKKYRLQLIKNEDLTPHLQLRNLPDLYARALYFLGKLLPIKHAILPSMLGSMALQQCLFMKIVEYRFLVYEKL